MKGKVDKLSINEVKAKAKFAAQTGISLTNKGYKEMQTTGVINDKEVKHKDLPKDKRAWFAGYSAGITETQVRYGKKGLFSCIKNVFSKKRNYNRPDIKLEEWQEESINNILKQLTSQNEGR